MTESTRTEALRAISIEGFAPLVGAADPGPAPMLQWLKIAELLVDETYQRPLTEKGRRVVSRIAQGFCWAKFSPVIVAPIEGGRYAIIDGQHRTTAAGLRGIETVPCQVVIAGQAGQAAAFASINGTLTRVTANVLHRAAVAAGDPEACAIDAAVTAAGARILRSSQAKYLLKPGDLLCIAAVKRAYRAHGSEALTTGLRCVTETKHAGAGFLNAGMVLALAALASNAPDAAALIEAVGRAPLANLAEAAGVSGRGGDRDWPALEKALRGRLGLAAPVAATGGGGVAPAGLSARDLERAQNEAAFVRQKRAAGVPWSHIAQQLVVGVVDLRRRHDPAFAE